jgi:hypothetical protein
MSTLRGGHTERLLQLGGQVIEPIPTGDRNQYSYFRGVHLGAVCLNYLRGVPVLNAGGAAVAHFSDSYAYARGIAQSQAQPTLRHTRQFTEVDQARLSELSGIDVTGQALPSVVVALDPALEGLLEPGSMEGHIYNGYLLPDDVDPYSREILRSIIPE